MIQPYKQTPIAGVDLDSNELRIPQNKAAMIKNMTFNVNRNASSPDGAGFNFGVLTPLEGNQLLSGFIMPSGSNYCVGFFESIDTNEAYVFVYNSNLSHFIYKIDGATGQQAIVYKSQYLNFQLRPENFIKGSVRCVLKTQNYFDKPSGTQKQRKFLIFTDNYNPQRCICVDDSIATNSYAISPYFDGSYFDHSLLINLGVPTPLSCIGVNAVSVQSGDEFKQNNMKDKMWQWRVKFINVWQQESEHGIISDSYALIIGGGCITASNNFPRCVDLTFECGNPLVDKIQIEFRTCSGNSSGTTTPTDWYLYDTIDKYDNSNPAQNWWQRSINPALNYNASNNTLTYKFCADKEAEIIPVTETNRIQNDLPQTSASVFAIGQEIALANNTRNFEPIDESQLNKIDFTVTPPATSSCEGLTRKIIIYAAIYNKFNDAIGRVSVPLLSSTYPAIGDKGVKLTTYYEWGYVPSGIGSWNSSSLGFSFGQFFEDGNEGFIGYLRGTNYTAISKQVVFDPSTGAECEVGAWDYGSSSNPCSSASGTFFQKFVFEDVLPGKYSFGIAGHRSSLDLDYQKTSSYTYGTIALNAPKTAVNHDKEIIVNCCSGDAILNQPTDIGLQIWDLSDFVSVKDSSGINEWKRNTQIWEGYIREDMVNKVPIELIQLQPNAFGTIPLNGIQTEYTDWNGFFFSSSRGPLYNNYYSPRFTWTDCINNFNKGVEDGDVSYNSGGNSIFGFYYYSYNGLTTYPSGGRRLISGSLKLCADHNIGISGALVVMKYGAWGYADKDGRFEIIAHNRVGDYAPPATDTLVIGQAGKCEIIACDDPCDFCIPTQSVTYKDCGTSPNRNTDIGELYFNLKGLNIYGLQNGGRYGFGIACSDWLGRIGSVQVLDKYFVDIPSIAQTQTFNFSTIGFVFDSSIQFPSWVRNITIFRTANLNFENFLTWIVDLVQFVDSTGNTNNINPTQIRLYYDSLNQYNLQYGFATNTTWQFIASPDNADQSVIGDQIEFIQNGDGTWFSSRIVSLVQYDAIGNFITIDYSEELKDLQPGAIVKLLRPKQWQQENIYYEQCNVIPVLDGIPTILSGTINAFDAYMMARQIPQYLPKLNADGSFVITDNSSSTSSQPQANGVVEFKTLKEFISFPAVFEHHSPSDFWGDHCTNTGRINVKNPYERKLYLGSEIQPSKALNNGSDFNGLSYFDINDRVLFDEQEWGPITGVLPEMNILLVITAKDSFVTAYNESNLQVDASGLVKSRNPYGVFSAPVKKAGQNYGCQLFDVNTIAKFNGIVLFIDRMSNSLIAHNYGQGIAVEDRGMFSGYLNNKISYQDTMNQQLQNYIYMAHAGIDPKTNEYYLTFFKMPKSLDIGASYVNNELGIGIDFNETLIIDTQSLYLKGFASFTPEYYGSLNGFYIQSNIFSFKNGQSWFHHQGLSGSPVAYNNFFGVQCKKSFTVTINPTPEKVKVFLYNEVYCKQQKFIADQVTTEAGQLSRIKDAYWDKRDNFYCASYLCDLNTPADPNLPVQTGANKLLDGNQLHGRWLTTRYISQDADDPIYCEVSAVINYFIGSEKSGN